MNPYLRYPVHCDQHFYYLCIYWHFLNTFTISFQQHLAVQAPTHHHGVLYYLFHFELADQSFFWSHQRRSMRVTSYLLQWRGCLWVQWGKPIGPADQCANCGYVSRALSWRWGLSVFLLFWWECYSISWLLWALQELWNGQQLLQLLHREHQLWQNMWNQCDWRSWWKCSRCDSPHPVRVGMQEAMPLQLHVQLLHLLPIQWHPVPP